MPKASQQSKQRNEGITFDEEMSYFLDRFLLGVTKQKRRMDYEPLRVQFHLGAPIALNSPWMFFDGLVGHLAFVEALGADYFLLPKKFPFSRLLRGVELPPLPIKSTGSLFHSSASIFDAENFRLEILYKKFEDRWAGGGRKISTGSGWYRNYMIQHLYLPTRTVTFYVAGDYAELDRLCARVVGLGDNTRVGWGYVRGYQITHEKKDMSLVWEGRAMRPIPVRFCKAHGEAVAMAWRPPYWAPENVEPCVPPGGVVELKISS